MPEKKLVDLPGSITPPRVLKQTHLKDTLPDRHRENIHQTKPPRLACTEPELTPGVATRPSETSPLGGEATRGANEGPREPEDAGHELKQEEEAPEGQHVEEVEMWQPGRDRSDAVPAKYIEAAVEPP